MKKLVSCAVMLVALHCGFVHAQPSMPDPVDIEPIVQKLLAEDGAAGDMFGSSVSADGNTAIIGAIYDDDNGLNSGSAYVFVRSETGEWTQQAKLNASDGAAGDYFGYSVALKGNTVVVGSPWDDDQGDTSGSAYIFVRSETGEWTQQAKLNASDGAAGDYFGYSVTVNDDGTTLIGAWGDDDQGSLSGSAYVFVYSETGWTQQAKLTASDGAVNNLFGRSVSISDNTVLVGAVFNRTAYVFVRSETGEWTQQAKLTASDLVPGGYFAFSVSLDGNTALIGDFGDAGSGHSSGSAYIFIRSETGVWTQQAKLTASDSAADDYFGHSVCVDGDIALIGARYDDDKGDNSGSAYVFVRSSDGIWTQHSKLSADNGAAEDQFGVSVSLSGNTALVGAVGDDNKGGNSGSAYIFSLTATDSNTDPLATGMTWGVNRYNSDLDISRVHCYGQIGPNRGPCNPYKGDTLCSVPLPILCLKVDGLSRPPYELAHCPSCAMNDEYYNGWSEGTAKLTDPVPGNTFTSLSDANAYCAAQLGDGYRVAEHHDGRWVSGMDESHFYDGTWPLTTSSGGWGFYVPGQVPDDSRFWVHINDQNANCWDRSTVQNGNTAPLADAGANQSVVQGEEVCFDGSGSSDADNDELTYSWTLTTWPAGSSAELDDPTVVNPCFTSDLPGSYEVSLVVNDGTVDSAPSVAEVVAVSYLNAVTETLLETGTVVNGLDTAVFKTRMINRSLELADKGKYLRALKMLRKNVLKRLDGCATSGQPDRNDWIQDCDAQNQVYPLIMEAIDYLEEIVSFNAVTETLQEARTAVNGLDTAVFKRKKHQEKLFNKINRSLKQVDKLEYRNALRKLKRDVLKRLDGCSASGQPDRNDWIKDCTSQEQVYPLIEEAIDYLEKI